MPEDRHAIEVNMGTPAPASPTSFPREDAVIRRKRKPHVFDRVAVRPFPPLHRWVCQLPSLSRSELGAGSILGGWTPPSFPATKHLVSGVSEADWGFLPPYHLV